MQNLIKVSVSSKIFCWSLNKYCYLILGQDLSKDFELKFSQITLILFSFLSERLKFSMNIHFVLNSHFNRKMFFCVR